MNWRLVFRSPARRRALIIVSQLALAALAYSAAFALRFEFRIAGEELSRLVQTLPYLLAVRIAMVHAFRLDRGYWQHVGLRDLHQLITAATLGSLLFPVVLLALRQLHGIPASVLVLDWLLAIALTGGVRLTTRFLYERRHVRPVGPGRRAFIVGAGKAGEQLLRQIQHDSRHHLQVVGLIDDDVATHGRSLHGVTVLGASHQLRGLVSLHRVSLALIAIPSATGEQLRQLVDRCVDAGVEVKLLPPLQELVTHEVEVSKIRDVQVEDLLGREPVRLDLTAVGPDVSGKVVLVTGAGGSIGAELARQLVRFHPLRLVLLDRAESPLYFTQLEVSRSSPESDVVSVLASVTNGERLQQIFQAYRPDVVFHAAAYKQVPLLEWNVVEGVWNNAVGTLRVARCAARVGTRKFVLISTDKAVNPTTVLGATKRVAERIVLELPSLRAAVTDFRVVRFGNVLGSEGSVVPLFRRQLAAGGPLTVTHPDIRRYFMTIPEAAQLVLQASALPEAAGRIALLEMGTQVRILELAEQLIRLAGLIPYQDVQITFTGLRPGEKLEEELLAAAEVAVETSFDKVRLVERNGAHGAELAQRLRSLIRTTARCDEQALLRALTTLVPEYQPSHRELALLTHSTGRRTGPSGGRNGHNGGRNGHNGGRNGHNGGPNGHNGGRNGHNRGRPAPRQEARARITSATTTSPRPCDHAPDEA